jgi:transcriptional regulator with XRE-family HTH domain
VKEKSRWCKEALKALIDRDMNRTELAKAVGLSREYITNTINGSQAAPLVAQKISDYLGIKVPYDIKRADPVVIDPAESIVSQSEE